MNSCSSRTSKYIGDIDIGDIDNGDIDIDIILLNLILCVFKSP